LSLATGLPFDYLADLPAYLLDLYEAEAADMFNPKKGG